MSASLPTKAAEFRSAARRRLPRFLFDYIDGAAQDELTADRNIRELAAIPLRQRVLRDVADVTTRTHVLGEDWSMPVALGPVGLAGMYARRGEAQAARAAARAGIPLCLSTMSLCSLAEVMAAAPLTPWFQLYVMRDRRFLRELLAHARDAGCGTLVLTVDMAVAGLRYRDARSGMSGPHSGLRRWLQAIGRPRWALEVGLRGRPHRLGNLERLLGRESHVRDYMGWIADNFDPSVTWEDVAALRQAWQGRLVLKGLLDADDARTALQHGVDGIVVSNHGGRQLDGVSSTAAVLPCIVEAVGDRLEVLVDGGVRNGADVVRMLALGARGVLLGRAWAYALGAAGGQGVAHLLDTLRAEIRTVMALAGVTRIEEIDRTLLIR